MMPWIELSNYALNMFAFQTFIVALAVLMLGTVTLWRSSGSGEAVLFYVCALTVAVWLFAFAIMHSSTQEAAALFWARAAYLSAPFIPSAIYNFTVVALRIYERNRHRVFGSWLVSSFFAYVVLTTDTLIAGVYKYSWGYYPKYGRLSAVYLTFFFGMAFLTLQHYWVESRHTTKGTHAHQRANRLLYAFIIAYLGSFDTLANFGFPVYPLGYFFIFCFLLLVADVIWQYRTVNITAAFAADQILQTMNEPLIVCDLEGIIRIVNPAYLRLFGYAEGELRGRHVQFLSGGNQWQKKMMSEGSVKNYECSFWGKGGSHVFVSLSASILRTSDGQAQGYVIVSRDVTERKQIERELKILNETLEERVQKRTEELANKIQELEWLNNVMMGREERILELKEKLWVLEQQMEVDRDPSAHHRG